MAVVQYISSIDWGDTGSMLQGMGTLAGAIAVYAAAKFGFDTWRIQKLAERNRDQAEMILHAAYNARRALRYVRSPWMGGGERVAAEDKLTADHPDWKVNTIEEKQSRLVMAQAYYMRIEGYRNERSNLEDCLPMARAMFGEELEDAVDKLLHQFHIVQTYADAYVDDYNGTDRDFTVRIRRALFSTGNRREGEENEINDAIESAIATIEGTCLPHLKLEVV